MPYKSDKQRRYMHAKLPQVAARWDREEKAAKKSPTPMVSLMAGKTRRKRSR